MMMEQVVKVSTASPWEFNHAQLAAHFTLACMEAGAGKVVPFQLRHAGPCWDSPKKLKTESEVMARGRWKTQQSVRRYRNKSRLASEFAKLSPSVQQHHAEC
eukprot:11103306-Karenia_brevis.AAC.1